MSAVFVLPLFSVFRDPDVSWLFKAIVAGTALVAGLAPATGLLALMVLLPLALAVEILLGPPPAADAITDILLFAFVAGAVWRRGRPADGQGSRLVAPATVFAAILVTAVAVDLGARRVANPAYPLGLEIWGHLTTTYFTDPGRLMELTLGVRWLGLLALALCVERILHAAPSRASSVVRMWLAGGAAAAAFALLRIAEVTLTRRVDPDPWTSMVLLWQRVRISALHPDFNAAGSYFALFLTAAVLLGVLHGRRWLLAVVVPPVLVAFAFTQSRAAFAGVLVATATAFVIELVRRRRRAVAAAVLIGLLALSAAAWQATHATHSNVGSALGVRREMLQVGFTMLREHPLFGVGIGRFLAASRPLITDEVPTLRASYPTGENAHNNYLQIAAELGLPALAVFLWMMAALWRPAAGTAPVAFAAERRAVSAGIAAFLVSAVAGHPLLIPQVAAAFFLAVGLAAGLAPPVAPASPRSRALMWGAVVLLAASLPLRLLTLSGQ